MPKIKFDPDVNYFEEYCKKREELKRIQSISSSGWVSEAEKEILTAMQDIWRFLTAKEREKLSQ